MPEACTVPIVLEESKLWKRGVTELEMQDTTLPSFSPLLAPPSCYMWILAEGQLGTTCRAWQWNKKGVAPFSYTSAPCCSGDCTEWEVGKSHCSPSPHVCLEEKHTFSEKPQFQASPEQVRVAPCMWSVPPLPGKQWHRMPVLDCEQPWESCDQALRKGDCAEFLWCPPCCTGDGRGQHQPNSAKQCNCQCQFFICGCR